MILIASGSKFGPWRVGMILTSTRSATTARRSSRRVPLPHFGRATAGDKITKHLGPARRGSLGLRLLKVRLHASIDRRQLGHRDLACGVRLSRVVQPVLQHLDSLCCGLGLVSMVSISEQILGVWQREPCQDHSSNKIINGFLIPKNVYPLRAAIHPLPHASVRPAFRDGHRSITNAATGDHGQQIDRPSRPGVVRRAGLDRMASTWWKSSGVKIGAH